MEEVRRVRSTGEREVPAGVEEQDLPAEAVHDASPQTRPNALRTQSLRRGETRTEIRGESNDRM